MCAVTFSPGAVNGIKAFFPACFSGAVIVPTKLPPEARLEIETAISSGVLMTSFMAGKVSSPREGGKVVALTGK
jgi:hypothetical protein